VVAEQHERTDAVQLSGAVPDGNFDNPYAAARASTCSPSPAIRPQDTFQTPFDTTALESKFVQAYVQNWNLTVEHKLGSDWLWRVGYVGTKATHLMADYDQNAPRYDFSKTLTKTWRPLTSAVQGRLSGINTLLPA